MIKKLHFNLVVSLVFIAITTLNVQDLKAQMDFENVLFNEPVESVIPMGYSNAQGTATFIGPMATAQRTYQQLIAASQLTDLVGKEITSISYRIPANSTGPWPAADFAFANFDIYLSGSVDPVNRSLTFENNVVGTQTQVRLGSLVIPAESFPSGASPNLFGPEIVFDTPWLYTGGNLLIEIRHSGFTGTTRSLDANSTSTFGYSSLYSACWTGNYSGTSGSQGNFCVINLKAAPPLSIDDSQKVQFVMYPNPAHNILNIESPIDVFETKIYALTGQLLTYKKHTIGQAKIETQKLPPATYILEIIHENGVAHHKFIKN
ncbi:MAG: T9SS type A sorting domain-containing protein [Flavobacterium sp.]